MAKFTIKANDNTQRNGTQHLKVIKTHFLAWQVFFYKSTLEKNQSYMINKLNKQNINNFDLAIIHHTNI